MNTIEQIKHSYTDFIKATFTLSDDQLASCTLAINDDSEKKSFGDLNSNAALVIAQQAKRPPMEIAQEIADGFTHEYVTTIAVAAPGFVNMFLAQSAWNKSVQELFKARERYFKPKKLDEKKKIFIEFVSANPTGPLHIGNGRGGVIGDVLGNILYFYGHEVTKEYYINDAGSQMKKLGTSLLIRCQQEMGIETELPEDAYHGDYLIHLAKKCITEQGKAVLEKEESFFQEYAQEQILKTIRSTLGEFGITFDVWVSEKSLHESGAVEQMFQLLKQKNLIYEQDGAWWFKSSDFGDSKDRVIKKTSGEWTYSGTEIAYLKNKIERGAQQLITILGQDHHSFAIRLKAMQKALELTAYSLDFILYQLVRIKEGEEQKKLSKRAGSIVTLSEIINATGVDVARFFFLHRKADAHLDFDLTLALKKTDENPVYYIQYAYVRIKSIIARAHIVDSGSDAKESDAQYIGEQEVLLIKKIIGLKNIIKNITANHQVHLLAYYAIDLANAFHHYYAHNRVINDQDIKKTRARLLLLDVLSNTFGFLFGLLGISKPEKM